MTKRKEPKQREKMSLVSLKKDEQEFSEVLSTDLRKLNKNKFFFDLEGEKGGSSQD